MFIQTIDLWTSDRAGLEALADDWSADASSAGTVLRSQLCADRDDPTHFRWIVSFESAEAAHANSDRPETAAFSAKVAALCDRDPVFTNLDVIRERSR